MYTVIKSENAKAINVTSTTHAALTSVKCAAIEAGMQIKPNHHTTPHVFEVLAAEKVNGGYELVLVQLDTLGEVLEGAEPFLMTHSGNSLYKLINN